MTDSEIQIPTDTTVVAESPVEAASPAAPAPETEAAPVAPRIEARGGFWWGTGRRKTAVARVRLRPGKGRFLINGRSVEAYFTEPRDRQDVVAPLDLTKTQDQLDIYINVKGGGYMGQAGAVKLGVSRALKAYDPTLEAALREHDMLTRDDREVERKKPGQPGARKRFQFSKR